MAVVLEIRHRGRSEPQHVQLSSEQLDSGVEVGRGYHCAVILTDPHVEPSHLKLRRIDGRIVAAPVAAAAASVGQRRLVHGQALESGAVVELGRTRIRVLESNHPVPATQPLDGLLTGLAWAASPIRLLPALAAVYALLMASSLLQHLGELRWLDAALDAVSPLFMALAWTAVWALVTRVLRHEARFGSHLVIALGVAVAMLSFQVLSDIAEFNSQSLQLREWLDRFGLAVLLGGAIALHLRVLLGPFRWYWLVPSQAVAWALVGYFTLSSVAGQRDFQPVPEYSAVLLPEALRWRSSISEAGFLSRADRAFARALEARTMGEEETPTLPAVDGLNGADNP